MAIELSIQLDKPIVTPTVSVLEPSALALKSHIDLETNKQVFDEVAVYLVSPKGQEQQSFLTDEGIKNAKDFDELLGVLPTILKAHINEEGNLI